MKTSLLLLLFVLGAGLVSATGNAGGSPDGSSVNATAAIPDGAISIDSVKRGQSVILHGTVSRIRDEDEFLLKDDTGRIEIYLGRLGRMPVKTGDVVTVHGRADDDVFPGRRPEIYASKLVLADGMEVPVKQWD